MVLTLLKKTFVQYLVSLTVLLAFAGCLSTVSVLSANWTADQAPPNGATSPAGGNASTTINTGSGIQTKEGKLVLGSYKVAGDLIVTASSSVNSAGLPANPISMLASGGVAATEYCDPTGTTCVSDFNVTQGALTLSNIESYVTTINHQSLTWNDPQYGDNRPVCSCPEGEHLLDCSGGLKGDRRDVAAFTDESGAGGGDTEINACWAELLTFVPHCNCLRIK